MSPRTWALPGLLLLMLVSALPAAAHGGGLPWIWIESEVVEPGDSVYVLVIDFQPNAEVQLELQAGNLRVPIGSVTTQTDGHGELDLALPAEFPLGQAELVGRSPDGAEGRTVLLVGDRSGGVGPPSPTRPPGAPSPSAAPIWQDPSVITLFGLLGGVALVLVWVALQRRSKPEPGRRAGRR